MKQSRLYTRRTKIVCTVGPATSSTSILVKLIKAGMNVARLNLSHGTLAEHAHLVQTLRNLSRRLGVEIAILIDLPGPKYRTGKLKGDRAILKKGAQLVLTTRQIEGDAARVSVNLPNLSKDVKPGDTVLLADGAMQLKVQHINGSEVKCLITAGGILTEGRGLVVPGMHTSGPFVNEVLREKLLFAITHQPDYVALSFVASTQDIDDVRSFLRENSAEIPIIAKIERGEAVRNFSSILASSDGVMVARGDLGVDIPLEKVPLVQKEIIKECNRSGKPVIIATEMLKSMVKSMRPTRAEVTDVANAIFDGTDATMLSEETSIGEHPLESVRTMDRIARETEKKLPYELALTEKRTWFKHNTEELISYNACLTAQSLDVGTIIAFTETGSTAQRVSKYRPCMNILAMTPSKTICTRLVLYWGVLSVLVTPPSSISDMFNQASLLSKSLGLAKPGDRIVITGGIPLGVKGTTNLLKVETVS
ncbi:MAG: pyruvate kinase [Dehalococcoidia bacterium]